MLARAGNATCSRWNNRSRGRNQAAAAVENRRSVSSPPACPLKSDGESINTRVHLSDRRPNARARNRVKQTRARYIFHSTYDGFSYARCDRFRLFAPGTKHGERLARENYRRTSSVANGRWKSGSSPHRTTRFDRRPSWRRTQNGTRIYKEEFRSNRIAFRRIPLKHAKNLAQPIFQ